MKREGDEEKEGHEGVGGCEGRQRMRVSGGLVMSWEMVGETLWKEKPKKTSDCGDDNNSLKHYKGENQGIKFVMEIIAVSYQPTRM